MGARPRGGGAVPAPHGFPAGGFAAGPVAAARFLLGSFPLCSISAGRSWGWRDAAGGTRMGWTTSLGLHGLCCKCIPLSVRLSAWP